MASPRPANLMLTLSQVETLRAANPALYEVLRKLASAAQGGTMDVGQMLEALDQRIRKLEFHPGSQEGRSKAEIEADIASHRQWTAKLEVDFEASASAFKAHLDDIA